MVGGGSGESLIAGPVRRGPWSDLSMEHRRDPRGARVNRAGKCGEGRALRVGATFQTVGMTGPSQAAPRG